jgi:2,4-dienoyl-CoA reductase-like NADH-dependent reductase (Old Yellow Enzyme family)/thioredoxin reductase
MKLLEPFVLKTARLRNRIVMASMGTDLADPEGFATDEMVAYYAERAKGGSGLILTELVTIDFPGGNAIERQLAIADDKYIPGLRKLTEEVHRYGAKIFVQLNHAGHRGKPEAIRMPIPVSASDVPSRTVKVKPRPLMREEISDLICSFGRGARRAREAGFDGIDLHFAHGYLLCQFLSPFTNRREDEYGGSFENRTRFPMEVLKRCRQEVGEDFPIAAKVTGNQYFDGGITLAQTKAFCRLLAEKGIDAIQVSGGDSDSPLRFPVPPMYVRRGCYVHLAESIKKVVSVPVMAVGRIPTVELANRIVETGKADLVAMGRAFLADPFFPQKAKDGNFDEIRPCIACNQGCRGRDRTQYLAVGCVLNPRTGREKDDSGTIPARVPKKVLVIGGGPGGMEAARVAALRGHRVTLLEQEKELGGQLRIAARPPGRGEFRHLIDWYSNQLAGVGVKILLNTKATLDFIRGLGPEVLILATGSRPILPQIQGLGKGKPVQAFEVLSRRVRTGQNPVIIGGGGVGLETADFLAQKGKKVTVIELLAEVGRDLEGSTKKILLHRLMKKGVQILRSARIDRVEAGKISLHSPEGPKEVLFDDPLINATGYEANDELSDRVSGAAELKDIAFFRIGDCLSPRQIREAISEGYATSQRI